ncbi:hypothetical protein RYX36_004261 [Vicia faba]
MVVPSWVVCTRGEEILLEELSFVVKVAVQRLCVGSFGGSVVYGPAMCVGSGHQIERKLQLLIRLCVLIFFSCFTFFIHYFSLYMLMSVYDFKYWCGVCVELKWLVLFASYGLNVENSYCINNEVERHVEWYGLVEILSDKVTVTMFCQKCVTGLWCFEKFGYGLFGLT